MRFELFVATRYLRAKRRQALARLDALYGQPLPLMMWLHQAPTNTDVSAPPHWFEIEIVSPWRAAGVPRYIAASEVACEEYFNPVDPADLASRLRSAR